jgi:hypothetical protein
MCVACRIDRQKKKKIYDWEKEHRQYIDEWEEIGDSVDENEDDHSNSEYRRYQAWYQGATRSRLKLQWTGDDYTDIESSADEDTTYDLATRVGMQVEAGPILDRVVND